MHAVSCPTLYSTFWSNRFAHAPDHMLNSSTSVVATSTSLEGKTKTQSSSGDSGLQHHAPPFMAMSVILHCGRPTNRPTLFSAFVRTFQVGGVFFFFSLAIGRGTRDWRVPSLEDYIVYQLAIWDGLRGMGTLWLVAPSCHRLRCGQSWLVTSRKKMLEPSQFLSHTPKERTRRCHRRSLVGTAVRDRLRLRGTF